MKEGDNSPHSGDSRRLRVYSQRLPVPDTSSLFSPLSEPSPVRAPGPFGSTTSTVGEYQEERRGGWKGHRHHWNLGTLPRLWMQLPFFQCLGS